MPDASRAVTGGRRARVLGAGCQAFPNSQLLDTVPWLVTIFGLFVFATALPLARVVRPDRAAGPVSPAEAA
jgi:hypothetical protein